MPINSTDTDWIIVALGVVVVVLNASMALVEFQEGKTPFGYLNATVLALALTHNLM